MTVKPTQTRTMRQAQILGLPLLMASMLVGCSKHPAPDEIDLYQYLKPEKNDVVLYNVRWPSTGKIHGDRIYQVRGNEFVVTYLNNAGKKISETTYRAQGNKITYVSAGPLGPSEGALKRYIKLQEPVASEGMWKGLRMTNAQLQYDGAANAIVSQRNCIMIQGQPGPDVIDHSKTAISFRVLCQGIGTVTGGAFVDGKGQLATELVSVEYAPAK